MALTATPSPTSQGTMAARKISQRSLSRSGRVRCRKPSAVNQLSRITSEPAAAVASASSGCGSPCQGRAGEDDRAQPHQAEQVAGREDQAL